MSLLDQIIHFLFNSGERLGQRTRNGKVWIERGKAGSED
jgi:hypothetical protein